jgi:hypothetical protein
MKKLTLGLGALTLMGVAYQGDSTVQGPNYTAERHAAMEQAFDNKDYNAWKSLMAGKGRVTQVVNQGNFAKFAEAHELAAQGKIVEAQKIRQDLGLGLKNSSGSRHGLRNGSGNKGLISTTGQNLNR